MDRAFGIKTFLMAAILAGALSGCQGMNPFAAEKPFVASAVPDDFAIIVDQDFSTYYSRQHMQKVITSLDMTSRAKYWSFRDLNNSVSDSFELSSPLVAEQMQSMWNEVSKNELMTGSSPWMNFLSDADIYRLNRNTVQIRANGRVRVYAATNGYPTKMRGLISDVDAIRLRTAREAPVVGKEAPVTKAGGEVKTITIEEALNPKAETAGGATSGPAIELVPGPVPPKVETKPATEPSTAPATGKLIVPNTRGSAGGPEMGPQSGLRYDSFGEPIFPAASSIGTRQ